jgi:hypothetical protein
VKDKANSFIKTKNDSIYIIYCYRNNNGHWPINNHIINTSRINGNTTRTIILILLTFSFSFKELGAEDKNSMWFNCVNNIL